MYLLPPRKTKFILQIYTNLLQQLPMSNTITRQYILLFLGGWLALIAQSTPAQGQINNNRIMLAQVVNGLPPAPPMQEIPTSQQPIILQQPTQPMQSVRTNQVNEYVNPYQSVRTNQVNEYVNPYQSVRTNQFNQNLSERYLVYVDNMNYDQLQRVRSIEPRAYIRQMNGRSVIQSGSFSRESNAQQRVRELQLNGINGAQVVRSSNGQAIVAFNSYSNNIQNNRSYSNNIQNNRRPETTRAYYVIIPGKLAELNVIANRIRQSTGRYEGGIVERQNPRGAHVAVGPFNKRADAEQWNNYVRNLGYGSARVYYGR